MDAMPAAAIAPLTAVASVCLATACALGQGSLLDIRGFISVEGRERTYLLHVPASYKGDHAAPLVFVLHGRLGDGAGTAKLTHFDRVSDAHGFLVAYPDGLQRSWADGRGATPSDQKGIDDVAFLSGLILKLSREYKIDPARIYAAGISNGGFMSQRLACELSDRIAAVGVVAATIGESIASRCRPAKPVSVMVIQGTEDHYVPIEGGVLRRGAGRNGLVTRGYCTKMGQSRPLP